MPKDPYLFSVITNHSIVCNVVLRAGYEGTISRSDQQYWRLKDSDGDEDSRKHTG